MIAYINDGNSTDCADILISNDAADGVIATDIDAENSTDFDEDTAGRFINADNLMDYADTTVSDDAADGLIAIAIDDVKSTDFAEDAAGGYISAIDDGISMNCADI